MDWYPLHYCKPQQSIELMTDHTNKSTGMHIVRVSRLVITLLLCSSFNFTEYAIKQQAGEVYAAMDVYRPVLQKLDKHLKDPRPEVTQRVGVSDASPALVNDGDSAAKDTPVSLAPAASSSMITPVMKARSAEDFTPLPTAVPAVDADGNIQVIVSAPLLSNGSVTSSSSRFVLNVSPSCTIADLSSQLVDRAGIPLPFSLMGNGRSLRGDRTLADCGINDLSVVTVNMPLNGGASVGPPCATSGLPPPPPPASDTPAKVSPSDPSVGARPAPLLPPLVKKVRETQRVGRLDVGLWFLCSSNTFRSITV